MRRILAIVLLILMIGSNAYIGNSKGVVIDYGESTRYSKADQDAAIATIKKTFASFHGCTLHTLSYAGDERCEKALSYCQSLAKNENLTSSIVFDSSFRSPKCGNGAWEADREYTWTWYLAKETGGNWVLLAYGYA